MDLLLMYPNYNSELLALVNNALNYAIKTVMQQFVQES